MKQGTTPTIEFKLDIEISNVTEVIFTFTDELAYKGTSDDETTSYLLQKNYPDDATFEDDVFKLPLTQEETDLLTNTFYVEAQVICDKAVVKSDVKKINMPHTLWTTYVDDNESDGNSEVIHLSFSDYVRVEGGGGSDNYNDLTNKPQINSVTLQGNKTATQLGLEKPISAGDGLKREDNTMSVDIDANSILEFNNHKLSANTSGLQPTISGGNGIDVSSDVVSVDLLNGESVLGFSNGKLKSDLSAYYTKAEIDQMISADLKFEVVQTLPSTPDTHTIYLVPKSTSETNNIYDEYMYINNAWELIGTTEVDLSNYQTLISSTNKVNADYIDDSESTNKFTNANEKAEWSGKSRVYYAKFVNNEIDLRQASYPNIQQFDLLMDKNKQRFFYCEYLNEIGGIQGHWIEKVKSIIGTPPATVDVSQNPLAELFVDDVLLSDNGNIYRVLTKDISSLPNISYTYQTYDGHNTTYTGGDGIDITNDTISVDIASGSALQITSGELDVDLSSKQDVIDSNNMLDADLVDDSTSTNQFVTSSEKSTWSGKEDKTTITTDTSSTTPSLTLADNNEYRYTTDLTSLTLTMPSGDFISSVVFSSGSTPTSMTYDSSIKWSGTDVTSNAFVPQANMEYEIVFWYNGLSVNAVVRGVA